MRKHLGELNSTECQFVQTQSRIRVAGPATLEEASHHFRVSIVDLATALRDRRPRHEVDHHVAAVKARYKTFLGPVRERCGGEMLRPPVRRWRCHGSEARLKGPYPGGSGPFGYVCA